ncbi:hypothetical protein BLOT_016503 [Blomia tropicalis]|nr:hypothetical protein BLOT_016503 [Blomia tropicalis]
MAKPVTRSKTREQPEIQELEGEQPSRPSVIPAAPNMQSFMSTASTSRINEPTSRPNERTPTIRASDLPTFDGKVLNWLPFKLVFSRVVLNEPSISDAQKLGLLIKVTSGRALNRVVALTQRELSTEEIFNSLEDYFHSNTKVEEFLAQMVRKLPFVSNYYDLAQFEEMLWQFRDLESTCSGLGPEYVARSNAMIGQVLRKFGYELRKDLSSCSTLEEMEEKMTELYESAMRLTEAADSPRHRSHPNRNDRPPSSSYRGRSNHSRSVVAAVTASFNSSRPNQQSQSPAHSSSSNNVVGAVLPLVPSVDQIVAPIQPLSSASDVCHARYIGVAPPSITIDRPAFSLSLNNRKVVAWLDTCSPYTMIRKALVDPTQTFPCRGIRSCGYSGGPISSSSTKINIMIEGPNFATKIEAYVMEVLPFCDMLIGTDMLSRLSKWDQSRRLKFETGFGDIHFGPVGAIQPMEISEDVDDDMLDMNVTRLDNGTFEASLPFLSDVRPASNYAHAFLQIHIREDHRRYLRLVWIERDGIAKQYEMTVLLFGVIASPAILTQVVNRIVQDIGNVQSRKLLENAAYMDDLIIGANDKEQLNQCLIDAKRAFESSGFKLHKIRSNILSSSQEEEIIATQDKTIVEKELIALCELIRMVQKILGILHNCDIHPEVKIFSDSKINVDRLNMSPNRHKLFVARKVMNILRFVNTNGAAVYHIPGTHNPADRFSRPANPSNYLITKPWILDLSILPIEPSPITVVCAVTTKEDTSDPDILEFLGRLPSSRSMVAWVRKWLSWIPAYRTVPSLDRVFIVLYRLFQRGKSPPSNIDNFVDDHGLIRFKSRDGISPVWIPPKTTLARVLLLEAHKKSKHNG